MIGIKRTLIIDNNQIQPQTLAEIGCGAGRILHELSKLHNFQDVVFEGYDISPQAIEIAKELDNDKINFLKMIFYLKRIKNNLKSF